VAKYSKFPVYCNYNLILFITFYLQQLFGHAENEDGGSKHSQPEFTVRLLRNNTSGDVVLNLVVDHPVFLVSPSPIFAIKVSYVTSFTKLSLLIISNAIGFLFGSISTKFTPIHACCSAYYALKYRTRSSSSCTTFHIVIIIIIINIVNLF